MAIYDSTNNGMSDAAVIARRSEYPFWSQGDTVCRLVYDTVMVLETAYQPLALDTPHPIIAGAILVEETPPSPVEVGWVQYERIYATVGSGFTTYGAANFEFPGITGTVLSAPVPFSASLRQIGAPPRSRIFRVYITGSFTAGEVVSYKYTLTDGASVLSNFLSQTTIKTDEFTGTLKYLFDYQTFTNNQNISITVSEIYKASVFNRAPFNKTVVSKTDTRFYFIPKRVDPFTRITINEKFKVTNLTTFTDTNVVSSATTPNLTSYSSSISTGAFLVSSGTIVTQWRGNIYQAQTTYVKAQ